MVTFIKSYHWFLMVGKQRLDSESILFVLYKYWYHSLITEYSLFYMILFLEHFFVQGTIEGGVQWDIFLLYPISMHAVAISTISIHPREQDICWTWWTCTDTALLFTDYSSQLGSLTVVYMLGAWTIRSWHIACIRVWCRTVVLF